MFRRNVGSRGASAAGVVSLPSSFMNRYMALRARRYASSNATSTLGGDGGSSASGGRRRRRRYYGGRRHRRRRAHHRNYWRHEDPEGAEEDEKEEKAQEEEKEKERLQEEELEKLEALAVTDLDLHIRQNAFDHKTIKYDKVKGGDEADAVLRRGQEFNLTVTFNRPYNKEKDDLFFILLGDKETLGKNLNERFQLVEEGSGTYREEGEWGARIVEDEDKKKMKLAVFIPPDSPVGEWDLQVKTAMEGEETDYIYECPQSLFILFNPWCEDDQVHYTGDKADLEEYILNDVGAFHYGTASSIGSRAWSYGQFDEGTLEVSLDILKKAFCFQMTPCMGNAVNVARALSNIINSGILVGNWSGNYDGGEKPTSWKSSTSILKKYKETGQPVRFGQCWVFSHVLTAVCRALGFPCRSVTNFDSAHDTDSTCTIDCYYRDGEEQKHMKRDSIWNFHVWNEVWIIRPELPTTSDGKSYSGWHAIDATPQEQSHGSFQCGPCPVEAVKRGELEIGYDTGFVFSEVNAAVVHWIVDENDEIVGKSAVRKNDVGNKISTKVPNGKPMKPYSRSDRLDLTKEYKYPGGSQEYKDALRRAVRLTKHGDKLFQQDVDLEVTFDMETETIIGSDLVVTAYVKNTSTEDKEVEVLMSCRTCRYWNHQENDKTLIKETKPKNVIKAGETETYSVAVPYAQYTEECDENQNIYAYVCATDCARNMPYSAQNPFRLSRPELDFKGPETAKTHETITVDIFFTNPLPIPLTGCSLQFDGNLKRAPDDKNVVENDEIATKDVAPGEDFKVTMRLVCDVDPDEESRNLRMDFAFGCKQFDFYLFNTFCVETHV